MVEGSDLGILKLKFHLLYFEAMSDLKINFDESKFVVMDYTPTDQQQIVDNFNCRFSSLPIS